MALSPRVAMKIKYQLSLADLIRAVFSAFTIAMIFLVYQLIKCSPNKDCVIFSPCSLYTAILPYQYIFLRTLSYHFLGQVYLVLIPEYFTKGYKFLVDLL